MPQTSISSNWREQFRAAVMGWDSSQKDLRVKAARAAIQRRLRDELHAVPLEQGERGELDDAMYFLHLLSLATQMEAPGDDREVAASPRRSA
ncbi:MAG TPA: hypothetical protein VFB04_05925 [Terriglobales bacterium]|nr:hypothetical protein [Terriglobales bacterium]